MKILAVTFDKQVIGGANRSMLMVLEHLKKDYGHDITLLSPGEGDMCSKANDLGIHTIVDKYSFLITAKKFGINFALKYTWLIIRTLRELIRAFVLSRKLKKENYDLIYTNEVICFFGYFLSLFLKKPHIWHIRSTTEGTVFFPFATHCFKTRNNFNIVISNYEVDFMRKNYRTPIEKIIMISNGVEVKNAIPSKQDRTKGFHMVHCGRLVSYKGQRESLEALIILINKGYNDIYLHYAGSIPSKRQRFYYEDLINRVKEYGLSNRVIFEGEVKDMVSLRKDMNVELVCSYAEPFGRVTIEAMYSNLAVIGSNTGGTLDIIEDGVNGILYQQGNPSDLASKIEKFYLNQNELKRIAQTGLTFVKTHFTEKENVTSINQIMVEFVKKYNQ